jgi:hypothetical protein
MTSPFPPLYRTRIIIIIIKIIFYIFIYIFTFFLLVRRGLLEMRLSKLQHILFFL